MLSRKPLLFKSFIGLTIKEFDDIYEMEIVKRYTNHDRVYQKEKIQKEREYGAERTFKMDVKNRFLMLLIYYRLYITYTLTSFLFDLDE